MNIYALFIGVMQRQKRAKREEMSQGWHKLVFGILV